MKFDDEVIFKWSEIATFKIRAEIIDPSKAATLAASEEASGLREGAPAALAVSFDISNKTVVFFPGPSPFVCMSLLTTRRPSHGGIFCFFSLYSLWVLQILNWVDGVFRS